MAATRRLAVCAALMTAILPAAALAQDKAPPVTLGPALPLATMQRMADRAIATCRANGYRVSVVIVTADGVVRLMLRDDDASPHAPESAERKAYTAASFNLATAKMAEMAQKSPDFAQLGKLDRVILVGGGLPIHVGGKLVGGIGVAGGIGPGTDETCANAALAALQ